ncbi:hypothetical protein AB0368_03440 [Actinoplanes sp. NPDC051475]|uniref:hypothetical protein n=1 Tax=Actinoplanes sp. NPDC051475 TaxID=3157225 RepID=UPI00344DB826
MADPLADRDLAADALRRVTDAAGPYLDSLSERKVYDAEAAELLTTLGGVLPEHGLGTVTAVERLIATGTAAGTASSGPRFFHLRQLHLSRVRHALVGRAARC